MNKRPETTTRRDVEKPLSDTARSRCSPSVSQPPHCGSSVPEIRPAVRFDRLGTRGLCGGGLVKRSESEEDVGRKKVEEERVCDTK